MRTRHLSTSLLVLIIIGLAWTAELSTASNIQLSAETGNYESSYRFTVQNGYYQSDNTLYVSSPPSLKDYYTEKRHTITNEQDYAKFVTPEAVKSIAENIRNITRNTPFDDEEFANAVLTIVREIPYVRSPAKYPVETIVDNSADCDGLSNLAASILEAGGLDVVLLLYTGITPAHMNIGVHLERMPVSHSWWTMPKGIDYENKTYWIAECTALANWAVGDRPEILANDKPIVIPLQNYENKTSASISSSLNTPLQASSTSINLFKEYSNQSDIERAINISGSISPTSPNEKVTIYVNLIGSSATAYIATTDQLGNYSLIWNVTTSGTYNVKTSWSGSANYSGSDSESLTVFFSAKQSSIGASPNYFWGTSPSAGYSPEYLVMLSKEAKEFLNSNLIGEDVILSGEFIVLSNGQDDPPNATTFTIPAYQKSFRMLGRGRTIIVEVPEKTVTIQGPRNQFGFILERTAEDNYTASVKLLTDDDVTQITQSLDQSESLFMNASAFAAKNVWHKAIAKISSAEVTIEVYDNNGTRLENVTTSTTNTGLGELGILMTYGPSQVLAFKNLKVETITQNQVPVSDDKIKENGIEIMYPYLRLSFLLAGASLAVVSLKGRKKNNFRSSNLREKAN
jgi:hypothetical protein